MMDLLDEVEDQVERQVQGMRRVTATQLGLDVRCGSAYVDEDCIVVSESNERSYNYYGGFEYVDEMDVRKVGGYTVYLATSDRVQEALECLMEKDGLCQSEDAE
jgi:hypothetical protein